MYQSGQEEDQKAYSAHLCPRYWPRSSQYVGGQAIRWRIVSERLPLHAYPIKQPWVAHALSGHKDHAAVQVDGVDMILGDWHAGLLLGSSS